MKKIYFVLCALTITCTTFAQTISNAGMETWRTSSAGSSPTVTTYAPTDWYSFDSLAISGIQQLAGLGFFGLGYTPTPLHAQLFQTDTVSDVHSGTYAAKLVSQKQDTFGILPGSLANAQPGVNTAAVTGGGSIANAITYTGGTATNLRITSVSAWVKFYIGKDSITHAFNSGLSSGIDSGTLTVQAIAAIGGVDTVVGTGSVKVGQTTSFTQITANVAYVDTVDLVYMVRIIFGSGALTGGLDSSIMYVDDVSMVGIPQVVKVSIQNMKSDVVNLYPNPAVSIVYLDGPQNTALKCELMSVSGQVVATKAFNGKDGLDVSYLPEGLYIYSISDANGNRVQRGKITVSR